MDAINDLILAIKAKGFSESTEKLYKHHMQRFLEFTDKEIYNVTSEDVKLFIIDMIKKGYRPPSVNLAGNALRFFYRDVMNTPLKVSTIKDYKTIPTILTRDEVKKMIDVTVSLKHKLLIELFYASGLRVSEAVSLKKKDIDIFKRIGLLRLGKNKKDRYFILAERFVQDYKKYQSIHCSGSEYIFCSRSTHISKRTAQSIVKNAALSAGIRKRVYCHCLRHSFATHLLEDGVDIRLIKDLLGHINLQTTMVYTHLSVQKVQTITSPLDKIYINANQQT